MNRKVALAQAGMNEVVLPARVQEALGQDPFSGQLFVFRGGRGDLVKALWWDGQGLVLYAKRLERGHFVWPQAKDGVVSLTPAQLSMLLEGIDWCMPARTWRPEMAAEPYHFSQIVLRRQDQRGPLEVPADS